jgi:hypothetical protein
MSHLTNPKISRVPEPDHAVDVQLGGSSEARLERRAAAEARRQAIEAKVEERAKRKAALAMQPTIADLHGFEPTLASPPRTRGECPDTGQRPCPFVSCRHHLWRQDEPAGRPGLGSVPRAAGSGRTLRVLGDYAQGQGSRPKLDATAWVTLTPRQSCALVVAEQVAHRAELMGNAELGELLGKHRTLVARLWQRAIRRFIQAGGTLEGLEALRRHEQERNR